MKFEIETYKGQLIEYDDEYDKFICDISIQDKYKSTKRASLKDVRKEIDTFVKLNLEFKPFKAIFKDKYGDGFYVRDIIGIRTDGKFIIKEGTSKSHYDEKDMLRCMVYDQSIIDELSAAEALKEEARKNYNRVESELSTKLVKMDLSIYQL